MADVNGGLNEEKPPGNNSTKTGYSLPKKVGIDYLLMDIVK